VQFHFHDRLGRVLDDPNVALHRALDNLDGGTDELAVPGRALLTIAAAASASGTSSEAGRGAAVAARRPGAELRGTSAEARVGRRGEARTEAAE
jgi:hypothetical protein